MFDVTFHVDSFTSSSRHLLALWTIFTTRRFVSATISSSSLSLGTYSSILSRLIFWIGRKIPLQCVAILTMEDGRESEFFIDPFAHDVPRLSLASSQVESDVCTPSIIPSIHTLTGHLLLKYLDLSDIASASTRPRIAGQSLQPHIGRISIDILKRPYILAAQQTNTQFLQRSPGVQKLDQDEVTRTRSYHPRNPTNRCLIKAQHIP